MKGAEATSVVMWVVTPSIRLEGMAARPIQISRVRQSGPEAAASPSTRPVDAGAGSVGMRATIRPRQAISTAKPP